MGKNKIGEALLKINSGQPGSPIGPEQPKNPIQVPPISDFMVAKASGNYTKGMDIYDPANQNVRGANYSDVLNSINWNNVPEGFKNFLGVNEKIELDPNTLAPKDPNWYKSKGSAFFDGMQKMFDAMDQEGIKPESALTYMKTYLYDPRFRKIYFNNTSPLGLGDDPKYENSMMRNRYNGDPGTGMMNKYDNSNLESLAQEMAVAYGKLKRERDDHYGVTNQSQIKTQQAAPFQGGMQGLQQNLENLVNPKLRVIKKQ